MKRLGRVPAFLLLVAAGVVAVGPLLWLLSTSLKGAEEIFSVPPKLIPRHVVLENYVGVWQAVPFARYFVNSTVVVLATVLLNVLCSSLAGYALARFRFRGRHALFVAVLAAMMVPKEVIIIPLYTTVLRLGLADTLAGVILPFAVEGFGIFLMRQAFLAIPKDVEEAGIIDGAPPIRLWWNVMLPMTRPSLAALAIFTFIGTWGDFLWPLIVLKSPEHYTVQVGLTVMMGTFVDNFRYVAAGSVLALVPVIAVFVVTQRYVERGIFAGIGK